MSILCSRACTIVVIYCAVLIVRLSGSASVKDLQISSQPNKSRFERTELTEELIRIPDKRPIPSSDEDMVTNIMKGPFVNLRRQKRISHHGSQNRMWKPTHIDQAKYNRINPKISSKHKTPIISFKDIENDKKSKRTVLSKYLVDELNRSPTRRKRNIRNRNRKRRQSKRIPSHDGYHRLNTTLDNKMSSVAAVNKTIGILLPMLQDISVTADNLNSWNFSDNPVPTLSRVKEIYHDRNIPDISLPVIDDIDDVTIDHDMIVPNDVTRMNLGKGAKIEKVVPITPRPVYNSFSYYEPSTSVKLPLKVAIDSIFNTQSKRKNGLIYRSQIVNKRDVSPAVAIQSVQLTIPGNSTSLNMGIPFTIAHQDVTVSLAGTHQGQIPEDSTYNSSGMNTELLKNGASSTVHNHQILNATKLWSQINSPNFVDYSTDGCAVKETRDTTDNCPADGPNLINYNQQYASMCKYTKKDNETDLGGGKYMTGEFTYEPSEVSTFATMFKETFKGSSDNISETTKRSTSTKIDGRENLRCTDISSKFAPENNRMNMTAKDQPQICKFSKDKLLNSSSKLPLEFVPPFGVPKQFGGVANNPSTILTDNQPPPVLISDPPDANLLKVYHFPPQEDQLSTPVRVESITLPVNKYTTYSVLQKMAELDTEEEPQPLPTNDSQKDLKTSDIIMVNYSTMANPSLTDIPSATLPSRKEANETAIVKEWDEISSKTEQADKVITNEKYRRGSAFFGREKMQRSDEISTYEESSPIATCLINATLPQVGIIESFPNLDDDVSSNFLFPNVVSASTYDHETVYHDRDVIPHQEYESINEYPSEQLNLKRREVNKVDVPRSATLPASAISDSISFDNDNLLQLMNLIRREIETTLKRTLSPTSPLSSTLTTNIEISSGSSSTNANFGDTSKVDSLGAPTNALHYKPMENRPTSSNVAVPSYSYPDTSFDDSPASVVRRDADTTTAASTTGNGDSSSAECESSTCPGGDSTTDTTAATSVPGSSNGAAPAAAAPVAGAPAQAPAAPSLSCSADAGAASVVRSSGTVGAGVNQSLVNCEREIPCNMSNTLSEILHNVEVLAEQKFGGAEDFPCNLTGCWNSEVAGVKFDISAADGKVHNITMMPTDVDRHKGFMSNSTWHLTAIMPILHSGIIVINGINEKEKTVASFIGEHKKYANKAEIIWGHWLIHANNVLGNDSCMQNSVFDALEKIFPYDENMKTRTSSRKSKLLGNGGASSKKPFLKRVFGGSKSDKKNITENITTSPKSSSVTGNNEELNTNTTIATNTSSETTSYHDVAATLCITTIPIASTISSSTGASTLVEITTIVNTTSGDNITKNNVVTASSPENKTISEGTTQHENTPISSTTSIPNTPIPIVPDTSNAGIDTSTNTSSSEISTSKSHRTSKTRAKAGITETTPELSAAFGYSDIKNVMYRLRTDESFMSELSELCEQHMKAMNNASTPSYPPPLRKTMTTSWRLGKVAMETDKKTSSVEELLYPKEDSTDIIFPGESKIVKSTIYSNDVDSGNTRDITSCLTTSQKEEISSLKEKNSQLKEDTTSLKKETSSLEEETSSLKEETGTFEAVSDDSGVANISLGKPTQLRASSSINNLPPQVATGMALQLSSVQKHAPGTTSNGGILQINFKAEPTTEDASNFTTTNTSPLHDLLVTSSHKTETSNATSDRIRPQYYGYNSQSLPNTTFAEGAPTEEVSQLPNSTSTPNPSNMTQHETSILYNLVSSNVALVAQPSTNTTKSPALIGNLSFDLKNITANYQFPATVLNQQCMVDVHLLFTAPTNTTTNQSSSVLVRAETSTEATVIVASGLQTTRHFVATFPKVTEDQNSSQPQTTQSAEVSTNSIISTTTSIETTTSTFGNVSTSLDLQNNLPSIQTNETTATQNEVLHQYSLPISTLPNVEYISTDQIEINQAFTNSHTFESEINDQRGHTTQPAEVNTNSIVSTTTSIDTTTSTFGNIQPAEVSTNSIVSTTTSIDTTTYTFGNNLLSTQINEITTMQNEVLHQHSLPTSTLPNVEYISTDQIKTNQPFTNFYTVQSEINDQTDHATQPAEVSTNSTISTTTSIETTPSTFGNVGTSFGLQNNLLSIQTDETTTIQDEVLLQHSLPTSTLPNVECISTDHIKTNQPFTNSHTVQSGINDQTGYTTQPAEVSTNSIIRTTTSIETTTSTFGNVGTSLALQKVTNSSTPTTDAVDACVVNILLAAGMASSTNRNTNSSTLSLGPLENIRSLQGNNGRELLNLGAAQYNLVTNEDNMQTTSNEQILITQVTDIHNVSVLSDVTQNPLINESDATDAYMSVNGGQYFQLPPYTPSNDPVDVCIMNILRGTYESTVRPYLAFSNFDQSSANYSPLNISPQTTTPFDPNVCVINILRDKTNELNNLSCQNTESNESMVINFKDAENSQNSISRIIVNTIDIHDEKNDSHCTLNSANGDTINVFNISPNITHVNENTTETNQQSEINTQTSHNTTLSSLITLASNPLNTQTNEITTKQDETLHYTNLSSVEQTVQSGIYDETGHNVTLDTYQPNHQASLTTPILILLNTQTSEVTTIQGEVLHSTDSTNGGSVNTLNISPNDTNANENIQQHTSFTSDPVCILRFMEAHTSTVMNLPKFTLNFTFPYKPLNFSQISRTHNLSIDDIMVKSQNIADQNTKLVSVNCPDCYVQSGPLDIIPRLSTKSIWDDQNEDDQIALAALLQPLENKMVINYQQSFTNQSFLSTIQSANELNALPNHFTQSEQTIPQDINYNQHVMITPNTLNDPIAHVPNNKLNVINAITDQTIIDQLLITENGANMSVANIPIQDGLITNTLPTELNSQIPQTTSNVFYTTIHLTTFDASIQKQQPVSNSTLSSTLGTPTDRTTIDQIPTDSQTTQNGISISADNQSAPPPNSTLNDQTDHNITLNPYTSNYQPSLITPTLNLLNTQTNQVTAIQDGISHYTNLDTSAESQHPLPTTTLLNAPINQSTTNQFSSNSQTVYSEINGHNITFDPYASNNQSSLTTNKIETSNDTSNLPQYYDYNSQKSPNITFAEDGSTEKTSQLPKATSAPNASNTTQHETSTLYNLITSSVALGAQPSTNVTESPTSISNLSFDLKNITPNYQFPTTVPNQQCMVNVRLLFTTPTSTTTSQPSSVLVSAGTNSKAAVNMTLSTRIAGQFVATFPNVTGDQNSSQLQTTQQAEVSTNSIISTTTSIETTTSTSGNVGISLDLQNNLLSIPTNETTTIQNEVEQHSLRILPNVEHTSPDQIKTSQIFTNSHALQSEISDQTGHNVTLNPYAPNYHASLITPASNLLNTQTNELMTIQDEVLHSTNSTNGGAIDTFNKSSSITSVNENIQQQNDFTTHTPDPACIAKCMEDLKFTLNFAQITQNELSSPTSTLPNAQHTSADQVTTNQLFGNYQTLKSGINGQTGHNISLDPYAPYHQPSSITPALNILNTKTNGVTTIQNETLHYTNFDTFAQSQHSVNSTALANVQYAGTDQITTNQFTTNSQMIPSGIITQTGNNVTLDPCAPNHQASLITPALNLLNAQTNLITTIQDEVLHLTISDAFAQSQHPFPTSTLPNAYHMEANQIITNQFPTNSQIEQSEKNAQTGYNITLGSHASNHQPSLIAPALNQLSTQTFKLSNQIPQTTSNVFYTTIHLTTFDSSIQKQQPVSNSTLSNASRILTDQTTINQTRTDSLTTQNGINISADIINQNVAPTNSTLNFQPDSNIIFDVFSQSQHSFPTTALPNAQHTDTYQITTNQFINYSQTDYITLDSCAPNHHASFITPALNLLDAQTNLMTTIQTETIDSKNVDTFAQSQHSLPTTTLSSAQHTEVDQIRTNQFTTNSQTIQDGIVTQTGHNVTLNPCAPNHQTSLITPALNLLNAQTNLMTTIQDEVLHSTKLDTFVQNQHSFATTTLPNAYHIAANQIITNQFPTNSQIEQSAITQTGYNITLGSYASNHQPSLIAPALNELSTQTIKLSNQIPRTTSNVFYTTIHLTTFDSSLQKQQPVSNSTLSNTSHILTDQATINQTRTDSQTTQNGINISADIINQNVPPTNSTLKFQTDSNITFDVYAQSQHSFPTTALPNTQQTEAYQITTNQFINNSQTVQIGINAQTENNITLDPCAPNHHASFITPTLDLLNAQTNHMTTIQNETIDSKNVDAFTQSRHSLSTTTLSNAQHTEVDQLRTNQFTTNSQTIQDGIVTQTGHNVTLDPCAPNHQTSLITPALNPLNAQTNLMTTIQDEVLHSTNLDAFAQNQHSFPTTTMPNAYHIAANQIITNQFPTNSQIEQSAITQTGYNKTLGSYASNHQPSLIAPALNQLSTQTIKLSNQIPQTTSNVFYTTIHLTTFDSSIQKQQPVSNSTLSNASRILTDQTTINQTRTDSHTTQNGLNISTDIVNQNVPPTNSTLSFQTDSNVTFDVFAQSQHSFPTAALPNAQHTETYQITTNQLINNSETVQIGINAQTEHNITLDPCAPNHHASLITPALNLLNARTNLMTTIQNGAIGSKNVDTFAQSQHSLSTTLSNPQHTETDQNPTNPFLTNYHTMQSGINDQTGHNITSDPCAPNHQPSSITPASQLSTQTNQDTILQDEVLHSTLPNAQHTEANQNTTNQSSTSYQTMQSGINGQIGHKITFDPCLSTFDTLPNPQHIPPDRILRNKLSSNFQSVINDQTHYNIIVDPCAPNHQSSFMTPRLNLLNTQTLQATSIQDEILNYKKLYSSADMEHSTNILSNTQHTATDQITTNQFLTSSQTLLTVVNVNATNSTLQNHQAFSATTTSIPHQHSTNLLLPFNGMSMNDLEALNLCLRDKTTNLSNILPDILYNLTNHTINNLFSANLQTQHNEMNIQKSNDNLKGQQLLSDILTNPLSQIHDSEFNDMTGQTKNNHLRANLQSPEDHENNVHGLNSFVEAADTKTPPSVHSTPFLISTEHKTSGRLETGMNNSINCDDLMQQTSSKAITNKSNEALSITAQSLLHLLLLSTTPIISTTFGINAENVTNHMQPTTANQADITIFRPGAESPLHGISFNATNENHTATTTTIPLCSSVTSPTTELTPTTVALLHSLQETSVRDISTFTATCETTPLTITTSTPNCDLETQLLNLTQMHLSQTFQNIMLTSTSTPTEPNTQSPPQKITDNLTGVISNVNNNANEGFGNETVHNITQNFNHSTAIVIESSTSLVPETPLCTTFSSLEPSTPLHLSDHTEPATKSNTIETTLHSNLTEHYSTTITPHPLTRNDFSSTISTTQEATMCTTFGSLEPSSSLHVSETTVPTTKPNMTETTFVSLITDTSLTSVAIKNETSMITDVTLHSNLAETYSMTITPHFLTSSFNSTVSISTAQETTICTTFGSLESSSSLHVSETTAPTTKPVIIASPTSSFNSTVSALTAQEATMYTFSSLEPSSSLQVSETTIPSTDTSLTSLAAKNETSMITDVALHSNTAENYSMTITPYSHTSSFNSTVSTSTATEATMCTTFGSLEPSSSLHVSETAAPTTKPTITTALTSSSNSTVSTSTAQEVTMCTTFGSLEPSSSLHVSETTAPTAKPNMTETTFVSLITDTSLTSISAKNETSMLTDVTLHSNVAQNYSPSITPHSFTSSFNSTVSISTAQEATMCTTFGSLEPSASLHTSEATVPATKPNMLEVTLAPLLTIMSTLVTITDIPTTQISLTTINMNLTENYTTTTAQPFTTNPPKPTSTAISSIMTILMSTTDTPTTHTSFTTNETNASLFTSTIAVSTCPAMNSSFYNFLVECLNRNRDETVLPTMTTLNNFRSNISPLATTNISQNTSQIVDQLLTTPPAVTVHREGDLLNEQQMGNNLPKLDDNLTQLGNNLPQLNTLPQLGSNIPFLLSQSTNHGRLITTNPSPTINPQVPFVQPMTPAPPALPDQNGHIQSDITISPSSLPTYIPPNNKLGQLIPPNQPNFGNQMFEQPFWPPQPILPDQEFWAYPCPPGHPPFPGQPMFPPPPGQPILPGLPEQLAPGLPIVPELTYSPTHAIPTLFQIQPTPPAWPTDSFGNMLPIPQGFQTQQEQPMYPTETPLQISLAMPTGEPTLSTTESMDTDILTNLQNPFPTLTTLSMKSSCDILDVSTRKVVIHDPLREPDYFTTSEVDVYAYMEHFGTTECATHSSTRNHLFEMFHLNDAQPESECELTFMNNPDVLNGGIVNAVTNGGVTDPSYNFPTKSTTTSSIAYKEATLSSTIFNTAGNNTNQIFTMNTEMEPTSMSPGIGLEPTLFTSNEHNVTMDNCTTAHSLKNENTSNADTSITAWEDECPTIQECESMLDLFSSLSLDTTEPEKGNTNRSDMASSTNLTESAAVASLTESLISIGTEHENITTCITTGENSTEHTTESKSKNEKSNTTHTESTSGSSVSGSTRTSVSRTVATTTLKKAGKTRPTLEEPTSTLEFFPDIGRMISNLLNSTDPTPDIDEDLPSTTCKIPTKRK